nr:hypothetical protein [Caenispirillum bisanense]
MTWKGWVSSLRAGSSARRKQARLIAASDCSSWPTPKTKTGGPNSNRADRTRCGGPDLQEYAERLWMTPTTANAHGNAYQRDRGKMGAERPTLVGQAETWPTPQARDGDSRGMDLGRLGHPERSRDLAETASQWPTPAARDYRAPNTVESQARRNAGSLRGQQLQNFVEHSCPSMPQARPIPAGDASLQMHRTSRQRLNPRFCEWLLGWPTGWTNCALPVTGFARWLERSRTELSRLISPPTLLPGNEPDGQGRLL